MKLPQEVVALPIVMDKAERTTPASGTTTMGITISSNKLLTAASVQFLSVPPQIVNSNGYMPRSVMFAIYA